MSGLNERRHEHCVIVLQCGEHFHVANRRIWSEAGHNSGHLGQPMHRLQNLQLTAYDGADHGRRFLRIGLAGRVLQQPLENHTGIEYDDGPTLASASAATGPDPAAGYGSRV